jgi:hypothetical protein
MALALKLNSNGLLLDPQLHDFELLTMEFDSDELILRLGKRFVKDSREYIFRFIGNIKMIMSSDHMQNVIYDIYIVEDGAKFIEVSELFVQTFGHMLSRPERFAVFEPASGLSLTIGYSSLAVRLV